MLKAIPRVQTESREVNQLQSNIIASLQPIINNSLLAGNILSKVSLSSGDNIINHGLNRQLQGWSIVRKRANSNIFDKQDSNSTPDKTLVLNASSAVIVEIYVF